MRLTSYVKVAAALKHKTVRDVAAKVAHMRGAFTQASVAPATVQTRYLSSLPPHMRAVAVASATPTSTQGPASSPSSLQPSVVNTLLAENATLLRTMRTNVQSTSMDANIPLMCKFRDNVHAVMDWLHSVPPAMPALPVELDTQLLPPSPRNVYKPRPVPGFGSGTSDTAAAASDARSRPAAVPRVPMQSPIQPAGARGMRMFGFDGEVQHGLGNGSGSAAASSGQH